jgi:hypothetical protein
MQTSKEVLRRRTKVATKPERQYPCPCCGGNVTVLRRFKCGNHETHLDGECQNGHRLWHHGAGSMNWFEDWKRIYFGCRRAVVSETRGFSNNTPLR